jgi:L-aminopeptidase/D-esterase-like protein
MSTDTLLVILLVWAVAGLFAAMAFGRVIRETDSAQGDEILASSTGSIKFIRRNKHRSSAARSNDNMERAHENASRQASV